MVFTPQQATGKKLGSYELLREVCASSVGATFVARGSSGDGRSVWLTKLHRHVAKSPQLCDNFQQAAKKAAALSHPNIAPIVDNGTADGEIFVAYEHNEGDSLASLLRRAGPDGLPLPVAERIVLDVLEAIVAAHEQNAELGHGELGPWCIQIGQDGRSRVTGFGVDRAISRFGLHYAKNLDRLPYAAPERVKAMSLTLGPAPPAPDLRADAFSAAVIAWELFTRQKLFASRMEAAVIQKVLASAIPDPKSQRPELSEVASRALTGMLAREPGERLSISELVRALETSEIATHEAVAEFASKQVDKAAAKGPNSNAPRAFSSVRPPPMAPAVAAPVSKPKPANGTATPAADLPTPTDARAKSVPPPAAPRAGAVPRNRAKTLMGVSSSAAETPAMPPVAPVPSAFDDEPTAVQGSTVKTKPGITDDPTSIDMDDDLLVEADLTPPPGPLPGPPEPTGAPRPPSPGRRPPPKPRQQTLLGIEPLANDPASATPAAPPAAADSPAKTGAKPAAPARPSAPTPVAPAVAAKSLVGVDRLDTGAVLGIPPHRYELLAPIARGGMATVWAARPEGETGIDKLVAVKTMLPELSDDADFETMFTDEMRIAEKIRHENVAQILAVGEEGGVMYLAMEWVDGETFGAIQEASRASGGIPLGVLVRMATDVCAGLHAAHELKDDAGNLLDLVHRDINPSNVIVGKDGVSKVVDFGIAKSKGRMHVTRAGSTVKGKTPYLSPEQLGGLVIDRRSDLFSLGALLYVMATGVHPFRGDSELKTIENIVIKSPTPLRSVVPSTHPDFEKLVARLLEKEPKKRPASADEVRKELERIASILETPASAKDVGAFVEKMAAGVLEARRTTLLAAASKLKGVPVETLAAPIAGSAPTSGTLQGLGGPAEVPAAAKSSGRGANGPAAPTDDLGPPLDFGPAPSPGGDVPPPIDFGADAGTPAAVSAGETLADAPLPPPPASPSVDDVPFDDQEEQPRKSSPWVRLAFLIVVGIAVGIGIIALIEASRTKPEDAPSAATTAPTAPTTGATAKPAPTPPPTIDVQPTATETPPATTSAEASATMEPTASAEPTETTTSTKPTGRPPVTARPPSTGKVPPKPPATGKKPPPKYNPTGI